MRTQSQATLLVPEGAEASRWKYFMFDEEGYPEEGKPDPARRPDIFLSRISTSLSRRILDVPILIVDLDGEKWQNTVGVSATQELFDGTRELLSRGGVVVTVMRPLVEVKKRHNYEWLALPLSARIRESACSRGTEISVLTKDQPLRQYLTNCEGYYFAIPHKAGDHISDDIRVSAVFATSRLTQETIAWELVDGGGLRVFVPPSEDPQWLWLLWQYAAQRYEQLGTEAARAAFEEPLELADWWVEDEANIATQAETFQEKLRELGDERQRYQVVNRLLYEKDARLEEAVLTLFKEIGCEAEKEEPGRPVDVRVEYGPHKVLIEVTGCNGYISRSHKKNSQLAHAWQQKDDAEKLVLLASTHQSISDIARRQEEDDFTPETITFAEGMGVCLLTGVQAFELWRQYLRGRSVASIIESIAETSGEYSCDPLLPLSERPQQLPQEE